MAQVTRGGMSAYHGHDGVDARDVTMNTMFNHPLEVVEGKIGLAFREYDIRTDSGGAGQWRGGVGQVVTVEAVREGTTIMVRGLDRLRFPPWGVRGGKSGAPVRVIIDRGKPGERDYGKAMDHVKLAKGQTVTVMTPGAAGYGDPFLREAEAVRRDAEQGFISREGALREYGVAIADDGSVDAAETRRIRASRVRENVGSDFDFGPEREAWERVFDDAIMLELNRGLYALPKSVRKAVRLRIFKAAVPNMPRAGTGSIAAVVRDSDAIRARLKEAMRKEFGARLAAAAD